MKKEIAKILKKAIKEEGFECSEDEIINALEIPPKIELGDYAFPCFFLSKRFGIAPFLIATKIRTNIGFDKGNMIFQNIPL